MALIYQKTTDLGNKNCLVLSQREGLVYPFQLGDWTEAKFGMFLSFVAEPTENTDLEDPVSKSLDGVEDNFYFGVKTKTTKTFPAESSDVFVGAFSDYINETTTDIDFNGLSPYTQRLLNAMLGVINSNGTVESDIDDIESEGRPSDTEEFALFLGFHIKILNKGLTNQQIELKVLVDGSQTDVSVETLYTKLTNGTFNFATGTYGFAASSVPYSLPKAFFIYSPWATVRTRVHNLGAIRIN